MDKRPIGVFDSGLGGLTAASVLEEILPEEDIIYFGDTANVPYGGKPKAELERLAMHNAEFLCGYDVKAVLVACGTVSSNALELLQTRFPVPFFGVVDAPCRRAVSLAASGRIALIATEATVRSGAFERRLKQLRPDACVCSAACPGLVPAVEAGHFLPGDPEAESAVREALLPVKDFQPEVLIMGCTHYPMMRELIAQTMGAETQLISVGAEAACELRDYLTETNLLSERGCPGTRSYFTSGDAETFACLAGTFLGRPVRAVGSAGEEEHE